VLALDRLTLQAMEHYHSLVVRRLVSMAWVVLLLLHPVLEAPRMAVKVVY
jgi:hypothetical protein